MTDSASQPVAPRYQTDLAQTPLPEILAKVDQYKVPGQLECRRGDALERIYLESGQILVPKDAEESVWSIFAWESGTVSFTPGREQAPEFVNVTIPIRQAILRGVRRMPDARALLARIGTKGTAIERTELHFELALAPDEQALLDAADGRRTLADLVNRGNPSENARILYGLFVLGLIRAKERRPIKVQVKMKSTGE